MLFEMWDSVRLIVGTREHAKPKQSDGSNSLVFVWVFGYHVDDYVVDKYVKRWAYIDVPNEPEPEPEAK